MATASRQVSLSSGPSNRDFPPSSAAEEATVEESTSDIELITLLREAAVTGTRPLESIVDAMADAARVLSGADGTALGLETKGMIVCRARSGNPAPPIGAPISAESGISGECLRTVSMLVCHDAMSDPRVDAEVCRSLGIRSIVAIPVRGPRRVAGILEAFSARPNAFDGAALTSLRDLAEITETAYRREQSSSAPAVTRPQPEFTRPAPATQPTPTAAAAAASIRVMPEDLPQQLTKKYVKWAVGGAIALLLIVGVAWWSWRSPVDETAPSASAQNARQASSEPTPSTPALELIPKPAPGVGSSHSDRSRSARNSEDPIVKNASERQSIIDLRTETPDTVEVRAPKPGSKDPSPAPEAPTVNLAPAANPDTLARLTSGSPMMPVSSPRISQGVVEAALIHRVEPIYPINARTQRLQGKVTLSATIATDGTVRQVAVVGGSPVLAEAAKTAVLKWKYRPATLNGSPIEVQKEIIVIFAQPY
jgi:TonB family protein